MVINELFTKVCRISQFSNSYFAQRYCLLGAFQNFADRTRMEQIKQIDMFDPCPIFHFIIFAMRKNEMRSLQCILIMSRACLKFFCLITNVL